MDENHTNDGDIEGTDAGNELKILSSDKKAKKAEVEVKEQGDNASTSRPGNQSSNSNTPPKVEKEEEGEHDSEQDDPTGKSYCSRV